MIHNNKIVSAGSNANKVFRNNLTHFPETCIKALIQMRALQLLGEVNKQKVLIYTGVTGFVL